MIGIDSPPVPPPDLRSIFYFFFQSRNRLTAGEGARRGVGRRQLLAAEPAFHRCARSHRPPRLARVSLLLRASPGCPTRSRFARCKSEPRSQGLPARPESFVKARRPDLMAQRSCMRSAPAPMAWIGTVFTTGGCGPQVGRESAGKLGDRQALRAFDHPSVPDIRYASWRTERGHAAAGAAVCTGAPGAGRGSAIVSGKPSPSRPLP